MRTSATSTPSTMLTAITTTQVVITLVMMTGTTTLLINTTNTLTMITTKSTIQYPVPTDSHTVLAVPDSKDSRPTTMTHTRWTSTDSPDPSIVRLQRRRRCASITNSEPNGAFLLLTTHQRPTGETRGTITTTLGASTRIGDRNSDLTGLTTTRVTAWTSRCSLDIFMCLAKSTS